MIRFRMWLENRRKVRDLLRAQEELQRIVDRNRADPTQSLEFAIRSRASKLGHARRRAV